MDAAQFFLLRYEALHGLMTDRAVDGLSEVELRARPGGLNSIAWLLWHIARAEDIGVNALAGGRSQVFDAGWDERIGSGRRDLGTSMTSDEVTAFSQRVDVGAIRAYWQAVGDQTLAEVRRDGARGWDETVDPDRIRHVITETGDYGPRVDANRVQTFYRGMTRGWAFAHFALAHGVGHIFEAGVTRGQLGYPGV